MSDIPQTYEFFLHVTKTITLFISLFSFLSMYKIRWNVNIPKLASQAGLKLIEGKDIQLGTIMYGVYTKIDE